MLWGKGKTQWIIYYLFPRFYRNSWKFLFYLFTIISAGDFWEVDNNAQDKRESLVTLPNQWCDSFLFSSPLLTDSLQHICSSLGERWFKFWSSVLVFYFFFHDSCFRAYGPVNICIQNFGSNDRTQCVSPLSYLSLSPSPSPSCACHAGYFLHVSDRFPFQK